jgi:putative transcriptional regulator
MKTVRIKIDPTIPASLTSGRIDPDRVDATTEADLAKQAATDEANAMQDAAKFACRSRVGWVAAVGRPDLMR